MPRAPRIDFPNALYHVISRGNGRADIFWDDGDRRRFLRQLADGLQTAGVLLYAYVLMDNHIHLLVRTPRANLSRFMQRLCTSYALYCRYKHRKPGHQLEGRFKAKLVEEEAYLSALTRYIHLNPVKTAVCRRLTKAQRVRRLEAWPWSSYRGYVDAKHTADFVCYDLLNDYGRSPAVARRNYRAYTHAHVLDDDGPLLDAMKASRHAIGGQEFIERIERQLEGRRSGRAQDADLALPRPTVDIRRIDRAVTAHCGVKPADLKAHGHHCGPAKAMAIELACRLTGWTHRAIGAHYGGISGAAVSVARRRIRQCPAAQKRAFEQLLAVLAKESTMRRNS
jgi:putative transposase